MLNIIDGYALVREACLQCEMIELLVQHSENDSSKMLPVGAIAGSPALCWSLLP